MSHGTPDASPTPSYSSGRSRLLLTCPGVVSRPGFFCLRIPENQGERLRWLAGARGFEPPSGRNCVLPTAEFEARVRCRRAPPVTRRTLTLGSCGARPSGLKCAPEMGPKIRISTIRIAPVGRVLPTSASAPLASAGWVYFRTPDGCSGWPSGSKVAWRNSECSANQTRRENLGALMSSVSIPVAPGNWTRDRA